MISPRFILGKMLVSSQYFGAKETEFLISQTTKFTGRRKIRFLPRFIEQIQMLRQIFLQNI